MYGVRFFALEIALSEHRDAKVLEKLVNSFNFLKRLYRFHTNYFSETRLFFSISRINSLTTDTPTPKPYTNFGDFEIHEVLMQSV